MCALKELAKGGHTEFSFLKSGHTEFSFERALLMQVVCALKELAKGGHTVIAVMHQVLSLRALLVQKVLSLLALLVQKYKYRHLRSCVQALRCCLQHV